VVFIVRTVIFTDECLHLSGKKGLLTGNQPNLAASYI